MLDGELCKSYHWGVMDSSDSELKYVSSPLDFYLGCGSPVLSISFAVMADDLLCRIDEPEHCSSPWSDASCVN